MIASRKRCSIPEALHIYNVTPRDGSDEASAPVAGLYRYVVRDCIRPPAGQPRPGRAPAEADDGPPGADGTYEVGNDVWVRRRGARCTEPSQRGVVTGTVSPQVVEVNGMPWHVRCLRRRHDGVPVAAPLGETMHRDNVTGDGDAPPPYVPTHSESDVGLRVPSQSSDATESVSSDGEESASTVPPLRRSARERRPPQRLCC